MEDLTSLFAEMIPFRLYLLVIKSKNEFYSETNDFRLVENSTQIGSEHEEI